MNRRFVGLSIAALLGISLSALSQEPAITDQSDLTPSQAGAVNPQKFDQRIQELLSSRGGQSKRISRGSLLTAAAYWASANKYRAREPDYAARMESLVAQILTAAERGEDVIDDRRGFFQRGYETVYSPTPELYSIYVPQWYDPAKKWPLIVSLHGGSSNHNVWMAGLLGHEMSAKVYRANFRTPFRARVHEDEAIIVAPQGLGQNHWMGEAHQDVLDVIKDVQTYYNIDDDKVFLNGLSNGAVASYKFGLTDAWRFAGVLPMSGLTDWAAHASGGGSDSAETLVLKNESGMTIAENAFNTHFVFTHGDKDPGFDVSQARNFASRLKKLGISFVYNEVPNVGHHTTRILWRDMRILKYVRTLTRPRNVQEVRIVTTSERSGRQYWVVLEDRLNHLEPGRIRAVISSDGTVAVETSNTARFTLLLSDAPITGHPKITVNGEDVRLGPYAAVDRITLNFTQGADGRTVWIPWDGRTAERKRARLSGPLGDLAWEPQVHVYGTQSPEDTEILKRAALLGARGWTRDPEFSQVRHTVVPDTELTPELVRERALVLYGNAANNAVLKEIGDRLPIRVGADYLEMRETRLTEKDIGAKFICPNPLRPDRYLVVLAGLSAEAVERGGTLPLFLPDYIVFDRHFKDPVQRMVLGRRKAVELGFFTEEWKLPALSQIDKDAPASQ